MQETRSDLLPMPLPIWVISPGATRAKCPSPRQSTSRRPALRLHPALHIPPSAQPEAGRRPFGQFIQSGESARRGRKAHTVPGGPRPSTANGHQVLFPKAVLVHPQVMLRPPFIGRDVRHALGGGLVIMIVERQGTSARPLVDNPPQQRHCFFGPPVDDPPLGVDALGRFADPPSVVPAGPWTGR